ncbi:MAG: tetratricopeptide repeat protein, partial [Chitinophagaceae bacterium]
MRRQLIYSFFIILGCSLISPLSKAQTGFTYNDPQANFKQAKEWYQLEKFDLAFPIFQQIMHQKNFADPLLAEYVQTEAAFYFYAIALKQQKADYIQAVKTWIATNIQHPRAGMLAYELAEYFFKQKSFSEAQTYYHQAGIENLTNAQIASAKFKKGYLYFVQQQFAEAKPLFNAIRQIPEDPNYTDANYYYGFISFYEKEYDEALNAFTIAEKNKQYQSIVPFYIAEIYYFKGQKPDALAYAEAKIKQGNQYYDIQLKQLAGHLLFEKKDYQKAQIYLEEYVLKTEKVNRQDLYELSYCYYEAAIYPKAIEGLKQLGGKEDSLAQNAMYLLADAYLKTNQKANARNAFLFCYSNNSNPTQKEVSAFSYAKLSYELNYLDIALKELQQFIAAYPNSRFNTEAKELLIAVLSNTSNYKEALVLFENLQKPSEAVQKIYPAIIYGRAVELLNDQQIAQATILLNKLMVLPYNKTQLPYAYFWKAELAYREGNFTEAATYLQNYLAEPKLSGEVNTKNARYILGYCHLKNGDYKQAFNQFQFVCGIDVTKQSTDIEQDAFIRMADCQFMMQQYKNAATAYDRVYLQQLKAADYALFQKAIVAGAQNKTKEKQDLLNNLTHEFPASRLVPEAYMELGSVSLTTEKWEEAIQYFNKVLVHPQAVPFLPLAYLKTGIAYYNQQNNEDALAKFTHLLNKYPNTQESEEAVEYIRNIFVEQQKPDAFVQLMTEKGKSVTNAEADSLSFKSALLRYELKDFDNALKGFEQYLRGYENGRYAIEANYFAAEIYLSKKQLKEAVSFYAAVAAKAPNKYAERSALQAARLYYFDLKDVYRAGIFYQRLKTLTLQQETRLEAMRGLLRCQYKQA